MQAPKSSVESIVFLLTIALATAFAAGCHEDDKTWPYGTIDVGWFDDAGDATVDAGTTEPGLPAATELFDPLGIHEVQLVVSVAVWDKIVGNAKDHHLVRDWHQADVRIDGKLYSKVGLKNFGEGSQIGNPDKPNIRIKFNQFDDSAKGPENMRNLRFKASGSDRSFVREPMFYDMARAIGVAAPRTSFAHVRVNSKVFGLYQVVEHADKRLFKRNFGNNQGKNFDVGDTCNGFNCPKGDCSDVTKYFRIEHDLAPGEAPDFGPVVAIATAMAESSDDDVVAAVGKVFDMDNLLGVYALEAMASDHDGLSAGGANFELYQSEDDKLMRIIRNGADGSFKDLYKLDKPWGPPNVWCEGRHDNFYARAASHTGLRAVLDAKMRQLQCGPFAKEWYLPWLEARRQRLSDELSRSGETADFKASDLGGNMDDIVAYLVGREQMVRQRLGPCE